MTDDELQAIVDAHPDPIRRQRVLDQDGDPAVPLCRLPGGDWAYAYQNASESWFASSHSADGFAWPSTRSDTAPPSMGQQLKDLDLFSVSDSATLLRFSGGKHRAVLTFPDGRGLSSFSRHFREDAVIELWGRVRAEVEEWESAAASEDAVTWGADRPEVKPGDWVRVRYTPRFPHKRVSGIVVQVGGTREDLPILFAYRPIDEPDKILYVPTFDVGATWEILG